jgi:hypothetical protein
MVNKKSDKFKILRFVLFEFIILTPLILAMLAYLKQGIDMTRAKKEYVKLVEIEQELYTQREELILKKEFLSSPGRIEKIATERLGFVSPLSITDEKKNSINIAKVVNESQ